MTILATPKGWPSILLAAPEGEAFAGLRRAIALGSGGTISLIDEAGLRGRGGSGFPTAAKWRAAAATDAPIRYAVGNGYGADPAAATDRTLLETNASAVVEGLAIAAWAARAEEAILAVRADAAEAIAQATAAADALRAAGLLGDDVAGTGRRLELEVRPVQGAYLLGQETILLKYLAGKRGQPEQTPPYPATDGLFGMPTVVNNVQTLAAVSWIARNGADAFRKTGTADAPGTVLVSLRAPGGAGVAEVPLGTTLRDIAALVPAGAKPVKAILVGGPSGGILPVEALDTPYTFEALLAAGAHLGSGSVIVADERACVVDLARVLTNFCSAEACGKTIPCRIGTRRLAEIGDRLAAGTSRAGDLGLLADLSADIVASGLCDHERFATLPLMSGLRYFKAEVDAHLERAECPAGVCHPAVAAPTH